MSSSGGKDKFEEIVDILEEVDERVREDMDEAVETLESYDRAEKIRRNIDESVANQFVGYVLRNPRKDDETLKMLEDRADRLSKLAGYERKPFEDGDVERPSEQNQPLMTRRQAVTGLAGAGLGALAGLGLGGRPAEQEPQQNARADSNSISSTARFGTDDYSTEDFQTIYNAALRQGRAENPPLTGGEREDYFDGNDWEVVSGKVKYKPGDPSNDSVLSYKVENAEKDESRRVDTTITDSLAKPLAEYPESGKEASQFAEDKLEGGNQ